MDIAKEILNLRNQLGLTQRQFSEKVGIKQPQLARIETGKQLARLDTLEIIAEKCGYSVEVKLVPKQELTSKMIKPEQFELDKLEWEKLFPSFHNEEDEEEVTDEELDEVISEYLRN